MRNWGQNVVLKHIFNFMIQRISFKKTKKKVANVLSQILKPRNCEKMNRKTFLIRSCHAIIIVSQTQKRKIPNKLMRQVDFEDKDFC